MRLRRAASWFRDRYLRVDLRSAALFRVVLASLCFGDTLRHAAEIGFLYSNEGVLTNHAHLYRQGSAHLFSLFHAFSSQSEVRLLFALGLCVQLCLLLGYRTRLFAIANLIFITSRDSRIPLVENGGYVVENLACLWACFLPLGGRWSIDAWRATWRERRSSARELDGPRAGIESHVSLVGLAVLANLAILYFFNVVNKTGHIWREGNTIHYVLYINRMVTGVAVLVREHTPMLLLRVTDWAVLAVEAIIFACIVWPRARLYTRPLAIVLMAGLHATLGVFMRLGPFSWFLIGWSTLLLLPVHWQRWSAYWDRKSSPIIVAIDDERPISLTWGRILRGLDGAGRIRFVRSRTRLDAPIAVIEAGEERTEPLAVLTALRAALPWVRVITAPLVWLGGAPRCAAVLSALFARGPAHERFFGLAPLRPRAHELVLPRLRRAAGLLREGALAYLILCCTIQAWLENKVIPNALPPTLKEGQELRPDERQAYDFLKRWLGDTVIPLKPKSTPTFVAMTINYPRIYQGWGMFAPNPISEDGVLAVDAYTLDGRRIDPLTGRAPDLDLTDSRGEGLSQLRQDYGNRIRLDRHQWYRDGLGDHLRAYHLRTGRPADELVAFDVYWVRCKAPKPGSREPTDNDAVPIYSYRKPDFVPVAGAPTIPPAPILRSAEKWDKTPLKRK